MVVAVIDWGVAYNHPDLQANMWDGTNCKDEAGDSVVGGCNHGFDFEDNDITPLPTSSDHGTHVAGTIAAVKNNNKGIIGVSPGVKIMALKFNGSTSDEIKAIDFAIQNGAKIINASFGTDPGMPSSQTEYDAINRFKAVGGIFIAAAGNATNNNDASSVYPCNYDLDNIICVAATDQNDNFATNFSNYGTSSVDVGAPGVDIYSTVPSETISLSEDFEGITEFSIPSNWTETGNWGVFDRTPVFGSLWGKVLYGDLNYPYLNDNETLITSATYDLSGTGANIDFLVACDTEYTTTEWADYMQLEYSADGVNFTPATDPYVGGDFRWDEAYLDLLNGDSDSAGWSAFAFKDLSIPTQYYTDSFKFRIRWKTNLTDNEYDGCFVNNINISKFSDGSDEQYIAYPGTSMAAPHVAGVAALVWSHNSNRTYSEVKSIILNTGDVKSSLSGKTVSGKRVNANNALLATNGPTITGLTNDATSTQSKTWSWDSSDSSDQYRFAIDQSATWTPTGTYGSTKTATQSSGNGTYYLHVQTKNTSGIESSVVTVSAVLDNTAPTVPGSPSISSPINYTTNQTWNWEASNDAISGTITYIWSIINAVTSELFSTGTTTETSLVTNLLQGIWNFFVSAEDSAGNESEVAGTSLTVDTTFSTGSITAPSNNSSHKDIPAFTASVSDANTAVASVKFQYKASSSDTFIDLNTDTSSSYQADWTGVTLTTNTTYNLQIVVTDSAGNITTAGGVSFTFDTNAPTVAATSTTADGLYNVGDEINVILTFSENVTSSDALAVTLETGTTDRTCTVSVLSNTNTGTCTYTVQAGDTSADLAVSSIVVNNGGTVSDSAGNAVNLTPTSNVSTTSNIVIDTAAPATFQVGSVITTGGNVVASKWNATNTGVNITVPVADDSSLTGGSIQLQARVTFPEDGQVFENVGSAYTILVGDLSGSKILSLTDAQFEGIAGFSDGDSTGFKAVITDLAGNSTTGTASATGLDPDQTAPVVNITSPITGDHVNGSKVITFTDNENENDLGLSGIRVCSIDNSTFVACNTTGVTTLSDITGFNALGQGNFTLYFKDTDVAGNTGSTSQANIIKDTVAPILSAVSISSNNSNSNALAKVGNMVTVSFTSDETIQTPTVTIAGNSASVSNTGGNNWRADYQMASGDANETVLFTINFNDIAGNPGSVVSTTGDNTSITFDSVNPVIETYTLDNIRISPEASTGIKDTASFDLLFSEAVTADFDILNSSGTKVKDVYDAAAVTNPQSKTWDGKDNSANYVPEGVYTIRIVITDQAGNSITDISKTITVNNSPLSLTPIGNKTVDEEDQLTFTAQADDEEDGTLTFSLIGAPSGATINSSTGVFNWTPTEVQGQGSYTFTVSVSSTTGTNASEEIVVTVNEVNIAPVASGSTQTTDEDTDLVITLSATDADLPSNTLTYSIVDSPSHGSLNTISGNSVTYTPVANYNGSDSFTFRANDGTVNSNTATVNITVTSVNDVPVASNGTATIDEDNAQSITMVATSFHKRIPPLG